MINLGREQCEFVHLQSRFVAHSEFSDISVWHVQARIAKERKALESLKIVSSGISTLEDFHVWFHSQHKCYNVEHQGLFGKQPLDDPALRSY